MRQRVFAVVTTCSLTAGCYYYQPLARPDPVPGSYLSATLTDTGADHLSRTIGPDVSAVRGRLLSSDSAAFTFSVLGVSLHHGESITWKGEAVTLDRAYVSGVEQRKLARGRTALIVGATILSVVTTYKVFQGIGLAVGNGGSGGGAK